MEDTSWPLGRLVQPTFRHGPVTQTYTTKFRSHILLEQNGRKHSLQGLKEAVWHSRSDILQMLMIVVVSMYQRLRRYVARTVMIGASHARSRSVANKTLNSRPLKTLPGGPITCRWVSSGRIDLRRRLKCTYLTPEQDLDRAVVWRKRQ